MQPLVFHEPTAEILFWSSMALWGAMECWVIVRTDSYASTTRDWTASLIVLVLPVSVVGSILVAGHRLAPLPGPVWWPVTAGLALAWAGIAFRLWAISTLGGFFKTAVVIQENHRVVERGPYRWLRHPSYTGLLAVTVGLGLAEGDWIGLTIMLAGPLAAFLVRIRVEERALLRALGREYADYAQRTARLVPGVF
jgi:protein-S-isoprenylcysteine O-methyltransferase Ste14